ncbi:MAG: Type secretion system hydrolase TadA/VirB11/CpaF, TadA subfamily [Myxococcaceae bacterium]|nr:Type secretion system hydrolase TadA/VirB11/CpaF, TadA subfamily [Myxococcaceae bacterium]
MIPAKVFEKTLLAFFAPIRPYLDDPSVSEIMINGPDQIYVERKGILALVDARFENKEALTAAIRNLSQYVGKPVSAERPILEGRMPDGSRVEAILPPVAPDGPHVSIRRFFKETLTVQRLVELDSLTDDAAEALRAFVVAKCNVMVAGGTGSGKTSMLNALSGFIPDGERVVVIEDSREVQFQKPHVVQLEARPADAKGEGAITIRDIFRATLRMRPDRVVVGEIRGGEALDIVQAMTSGHGGCMGTLHATYPRDTLTRMETMAMMSDVDMPLAAMRAQIGSGINIIVQVARLQDGSRKVTHITEVLGFDIARQAYDIQDLYVRRYSGMTKDNRIRSRLAPTGVLPVCRAQLEEHGVSLPAEMIRCAASAAAQKEMHDAAQ